MSFVNQEQRSLEGTGFLDMSKLVDAKNFKGYRGLAVHRLDHQKIDEFQDELAARVGKVAKLDSIHSNIHQSE